MLTPNIMASGSGALGHESQALISDPTEEVPENSFTPYTPWGQSEKTVVYEPESPHQTLNLPET